MSMAPPGGSQIRETIHKRSPKHHKHKSAKQKEESIVVETKEGPVGEIESQESSHWNKDGSTSTASQPATLKTQGITCIGDYMITEQVLGVGSFGVVRLGFRLAPPATSESRMSPRRSADESFSLHREKVAIKIISRDDPKRIEALYKEIEILQQVGNFHSGIVRLHEVYEDENNLYMIFQHKSCDLYAYMEKHGRLNEDTAMRIFDQLIDAVSYLHQHHVAHRDIKLENILLDEETLEVALADFGFATKYEPTEKLNKWCGSPYTVSPEIIAHVPYDPEKVDVWALGSVLYTMLCGQFPFQADTINDVLRKTKAFRMNKFHSDVGYSSRDLIKSMMNYSWEKRMTLARCRQHPWMRFAAATRNRSALDQPDLSSLWGHMPAAVGESKSSGERKSPR